MRLDACLTGSGTFVDFRKARGARQNCTKVPEPLDAALSCRLSQLRQGELVVYDRRRRIGLQQELRIGTHRTVNTQTNSCSDHQAKQYVIDLLGNTQGDQVAVWRQYMNPNDTGVRVSVVLFRDKVSREDIASCSSEGFRRHLSCSFENPVSFAE